MFKYSPDGNYNDMIMRVINKAIEDAQSASPDSKENKEKSNYSDFEGYMSRLFESVYNQEWMINTKSAEGVPSFKHISESHK